MEITDDKISVYINEENVPFLEVKKLTVTSSKKIGLWTGNGSSGRFRNLTIVYKD